MDDVNEPRAFSLRFAMMKASKFVPKGRQRELDDFGVAVAVFEQQLRLAGFRVVRDERPPQGLPTCGD